MPGSTYSSPNPAAFKSAVSEEFVVVDVVELVVRKANRPVRKDVLFVDKVIVRFVLLGVVPERVIVGVRRVRRVALWSLLASSCTIVPFQKLTRRQQAD